MKPNKNKSEKTYTKSEVDEIDKLIHMIQVSSTLHSPNYEMYKDSVTKYRLALYEQALKSKKEIDELKAKLKEKFISFFNRTCEDCEGYEGRGDYLWEEFEKWVGKE